MVRIRVTGVMLALVIGALSTAAVRESEWSKVNEATSKGLPKSAIEALDPIIRDALRDRAWAEAARAIVQKIALEASVQGDRPEEKIRRLQARIPQLPAPMRPVLEAILAHQYWEYFGDNRWRFAQRSATANRPGDDITTWDLPRIYAEIDAHFARALADPELLRRTPIARWDALLQRGNAPDAYRPTLYDFVAFDALSFYASGEQAAARPEDAFVLQAESPVFAPAEAFARWQIVTPDSTSPIVRALKLYQDVLRFHAADRDPSARLDADLWRLELGWNYATADGKAARYKRALEDFAQRHADHELSARALAALAGVLMSEDDRVAAHRVASVGASRFPASVGGRRCSNLIERIEQPGLDMSTEWSWSDPLPTIDVRYRNLREVYLRVVPVDAERWIGSERQENSLGRDEIIALAARTPVRAWRATLPATSDYRDREERLQAPTGLGPGSYVLLACDSPAFAAGSPALHATLFWVTDLALVLRRGAGGGLDGLVLDARTGDPIAGATIRAWTRRDWRRWEEEPAARSDANGGFRIGRGGDVHVVLASHGRQRLASPGPYWGAPQGKPSPFQRTLFFTDRSIYRPGQTIRYKGLCIDVDQERDRYEVIGSRTVKVVFRDPNGKEIERRDHVTNDFGSFSGSFTGPRDRLLGSMTIATDGGPPGETSIRVEEYKRPKFLVTLQAPATAPRLDDSVGVTGTATAYTGAAVDGAAVSWRVARGVRYPVWWSWYFWGERTPESQEIAHGSATTGADGRFVLGFVARPDSTVSIEAEPTFTYTISVSVTDPSGETRTAERTVSVGVSALAATLTAADWQVSGRPVEISARTTSLDGVAQAASGRLTVYRLKQPERIERGRLEPNAYPFDVRQRGTRIATRPEGWPEERAVFERTVQTDTAGRAAVQVPLPVGMYRARLLTQDRFGRPVRAELPIRVLDPSADRLALRIPDLLAAPRWSLEPGEELIAVWGSGFARARAFVEVEHRGRLLRAFWTHPARTQIAIRQRVTEEMRGGFSLRVTMVHENRAWVHEQHVDVPWSDRKLTVRWEHMVSKLLPGQRETWTAVIAGPKVERAPAEMVATLYDASLDALSPHAWPGSFDVFRQEYSSTNSQFENRSMHLQSAGQGWQAGGRDESLTYRTYPSELMAYGYSRWGMKSAYRGAREIDQLEVQAGAPVALTMMTAKRVTSAAAELAAPSPAPTPATAPDLSRISARRNLEETAFFFPHLLADREGEVRLEFTMPEAVTEWRFIGFAHARDLASGSLEGRAVTAKDLMVQPNPPRFLREGDVLEFTVKVTNRSDVRQTGRVSLNLRDALADRPADAALHNDAPERVFDVPPLESRTYAWRLTVPDDIGALSYRAVAGNGRVSDGEEGLVPVVSRSVLVTESLPLPIRGPQTRTFDFASLRGSAGSPSIRHRTLTVQMVSHPAWYAVMALPYLMEYPYECSEQTFNRLYANALAGHIAASDPKIRRVFDQWRGTQALDSPLEKNQDLKAVMLEETPWLRQGEAESQARRNVGVLFDANRLESETASTQRRLADLQLADGAWPWFPGGPANDYITLYITTGYGRLRHLGVRVDEDAAIRSLSRLDAWVERLYLDILRDGTRDRDHLSPTIALYLYGRSFFLHDQPIRPEHKEAVDFWLAQARAHWLRLDSRQSQAHVALALLRFGDTRTPHAILASLRERSVRDPEMGMYWRDEELSWWWYRAPIESQAMMIEAFDEVEHDAAAVEECRVWLLKQKQTQDWKTTKATADAVYALLLRGGDLLAANDPVEVALAGHTVRPENVEAGTGFYERRFQGREISAAMAQVTVRKTDPGVAWGSVHWQYLEDLNRVRPWAGTPLTLRKTLFVRRPSVRGPVLEPVRGPLAVGDELVVRIELRSDRDMEYVHLKDDRGSGVEPVNVLSRYRYQDGLAYYEETRDVASHFFIDYLPKGTYVFEYPVRVQHRGRYPAGLAQIQCMYAPEFDSHSESAVLEVR